MEKVNIFRNKKLSVQLGTRDHSNTKLELHDLLTSIHHFLPSKGYGMERTKIAAVEAHTFFLNMTIKYVPIKQKKNNVEMDIQIHQQHEQRLIY
jgi:hypothetical protein